MILPSSITKVEDQDEVADRKPKHRDRTTIRVKPPKSQEDGIVPLWDSRHTPDPMEYSAKIEDSKSVLTRAGEQVKSREDSIPLIRGTRRTPDSMLDTTKAEDSKSDVLAGDPIRDEDHQHEAEPRDPRALAAGSDVIVRDGRALATIEVVLPRWKDVLRRKPGQARSEARHMEEQMPAHPGGMGREVTALAEQPGVKREPVEDPESRVLERYNPGPDEVAQAIQEMRNPDVKVKKELMLSDEYLLDALTWEGINHRFPIPVPRDIAECPLPRAYISNLYGGGLQDTFAQPRAELVAWHGLRHWAFWTLDWNPHAPTRPGFSGLLFTVGKAQDDLKEVRRTFVRVAPGKWVYMGQYKMRPGKSLTAESWKQQKELSVAHGRMEFSLETGDWRIARCLRGSGCANRGGPITTQPKRTSRPPTSSSFVPLSRKTT
ncbi:hypothetical protein OH76DRAFT_1383565 [Lentinus brumalis]|uniref:DUF6697 domain-containing protein n=1 Tax=Lentinus brumalis TaxID=2498619 RepID=A0A371D7N2_9APHY|nr:hypothetical protein OH76DRAFT_1383565 [Polyporus brumalis]